MPQGVVIIGVQWGDEGKGKIVDYYTSSADVVARFQGGNNAGHTLVVGGQQTILHLIPSGILHPHSKCVIGSGVVFDPENFLKEVDLLKKAGIPNLESRLAVSDRAHLIVDYHKALDGARETKRAAEKKEIGTTKRGIGPAYEDRAARRGLRICDLYNEAQFTERMNDNLAEKNFLLKEFYKVDPVAPGEFMEKYREIAKRIKPFVRDVSKDLEDDIQAGKKVLYEGAQGVLLDMDYGTYPFVTSSHTLPSQAALGLGARLPKDTLFIGVIKAYSTRVGKGPFPTDLTGPDAKGNEKDRKIGEYIQTTGKEFGATTGRARGCGWLDLVAVNYALRISGIKNLAVTKADILSGIEEIKVCVAYDYKGEKLTTLPADTSILEQVKPVYETLPGWKESLDGIRTKAELPKNLLAYLDYIEQHTGAKINLVSTGAGREAVIDIQKAF